MDSRDYRLPLWVWALAALSAWAFALSWQGPSIALGDSGETVTAAAVLGIAHPPGHPLAILLARLACVLPLGTAAFRVNLLSAFSALSASVLLGDWIVLQWSRSGWPISRSGMGAAALAGAVALFFSPMVLEQALTAKGLVYTLSLLWMVLILRSARFGAEFQTGRTVLLFFLEGLAAATHWPTALVGGVFFLLWLARNRRGNIFSWLLGAVAFVCGLSVYLYLPLRAGLSPPLDWGHPVTWDAFLWVVSRTPYAEWARPDGNWVYRIGQFREVGKQLLFAFPFACLAPVGFFFWKGRRSDAAWAYGAVIAFSALAVAVVPKLQPESYYLVSAYLAAFLCIWVFLAVLGLVLLGVLLFRRGPFGVAVFLFMSFAALGFWLPLLRPLDRSRDLMPHDLGVNALQTLPKRAVILPEGDTFVVSLLHAKWVEKLRNDVSVYPAVFLAEEWGFDQAMRETGLEGGESVPNFSSLERIRFFHRAAIPDSNGGKREVFVTSENGVLQALDDSREAFLEPWGLTFRLSRDIPDASTIHRDAWRLCGLYARRGGFGVREDIRRDPRMRDLYVYYANPFIHSGNALQAEGRSPEAADDYQEALRVLPDCTEALTDLAAAAGAMGMPAMAEMFCRKALASAPDNATAWNNLGNACFMGGRWNDAADAYDRVLSLQPDFPTAKRDRGNALTLLQRREPPPVAGHDAAWYRAFALRCREEGRGWMADAAEETAGGMENGKSVAITR